MTDRATLQTGTAQMIDPKGTAGHPLWRVIRIAALGLVVVFFLGVAAGFVQGHMEDGGGLSAYFVAILAAVLLCILVGAWLVRREFQRSPLQEPLTAKERLNRNILVACGVMGGVIGVALAVVGGPDIAKGGGPFSNDPLPTGLAVILVIAIGALLPAIALYWHRHAIDEQEADAYKSGALAALYLYMIGAPVWWFAWRGGFAPQPDGVIIYMATVTVVGVVWLWKKYR